MKILHLLFLGVVLTATTRAADPVDPSVKIREQLRGVTLQLRTAQTESANAQAEKLAAEQKNAELADKNKALETRLTALNKQATADKVATDKSIAALEGKLAERDQLLIQYQQAFENAKAAYQKADSAATTTAEQRAKLAAELTATKHTLADRERKNIALFNISNEILGRYENYALGKALGAREPFIGTTRVKIENLVQGYQDKILDNRLQAPAAKP